MTYNPAIMNVNFTRKEDLDVLYREFQQTQAHVTETKTRAVVAARRATELREYHALCEDYEDMFSTMMKKLLDARTASDQEKIRVYFSNKLIPLQQKLKLAERKVDDNVLASNTTVAATGVADSVAASVQARVEAESGSSVLSTLDKIKETLLNMDPKAPPDQVLQAIRST